MTTRQNHPRFSVSLRSVWSLIISGVLILVTLTSVAETRTTPSRGSQSREPIINRLPYAPTEPLAITGVKVNGKLVGFDKPFPGGDDWLKSLSVSLKNVSTKRILFARVVMSFPPPPNSQARNSLFYLFYGNISLLRQRAPTAVERLQGLAPRETADVQFSSSRYDNFRRFLADIGQSNVANVGLSLSDIIFEDDTMWGADGLFQRDPTQPGSWIPLPTRVSQRGTTQPRGTLRNNLFMQRQESIRSSAKPRFAPASFGGAWSLFNSRVSAPVTGCYRKIRSDP